jgi:putative membrane protein
MRTWIKLAALGCAFGLVGSAGADHEKDHKDKSGKDEKAFNDTYFVDHAYTGGQNEVLLGKLALQRARNEDVRRFAQTMVEDHTKANQDLILIVSEHRIAIPDKPLPEQEKGLRHLHDAGIKDFDKEYMDHMVKDHEKAVKLFERGSKELKNDKLKGFAAKSLPKLREHLKMAKDVQAKVGKADAGQPDTGTRTTREPRESRDPRASGTGLTDADFVTKAATSGKAEVAIGKLGQEKGKNADTKKFADRVVTDHTKANDELMRAARDAGISISERPDDQSEHVKHLRDASNFDKAFADHMVKSHEKGVDLFTRASKELKNEKLRAFAAKTLPTLKEHLQMAKDLQAKVGRERE